MKAKKIDWENPFWIMEESNEDLAARLIDMSKIGETPMRAIALQTAAIRLLSKSKETKCE